MKKERIISYLTCMVFLSLLICDAVAATMADPVFDFATVTISSGKNASFAAGTYEEMNSISVTRVCLYQMSSSGAWIYVCELPLPGNIAIQAIQYSAGKDYSAYIGSGTYRLFATFTADGHDYSRYSNIRTY